LVEHLGQRIVDELAPTYTEKIGDMRPRANAQIRILSHDLRVSVDEDNASLMKHYTGRLTGADSLDK
jgi:hypothetical protein